MKQLLLVLAVLAVPAVISKVVDDPNIKKVVSDCEAQSGVPKDHVNKLRNGEGIDCPDLRAYSLCVFKKLGYINDNGILQTDVLREGLKLEYSDENAEKLINACAKQRDTPELTAYETILCGYKKAKQF